MKPMKKRRDRDTPTTNGPGSEPREQPPPIAEKVQFWQEQNRINQELIPRIVALADEVGHLRERLENVAERQVVTAGTPADGRLSSLYHLSPYVAWASLAIALLALLVATIALVR